ncbi:MAG: hypothetical protein EBQ62_02750 [Alphaproteobacteria bacterium]|nr:hypothetical protein [Alphaproteobacteria bacterium]
MYLICLINPPSNKKCYLYITNLLLFLNNKLEILDLSGNKINDNGLIYIAVALKK